MAYSGTEIERVESKSLAVWQERIGCGEQHSGTDCRAFNHKDNNLNCQMFPFIPLGVLKTSLRTEGG
jgi:hypothetical protein